MTDDPPGRTGRDLFEVKMFPPGGDSDGAVFVSHPLGDTQPYGPKDADGFWSKSADERREVAIGVYVRSIDPLESDMELVAQIHRDAKAAGVEL